MEKDWLQEDGRPYGQPALVAALPEPVPVSASGDGQAQGVASISDAVLLERAVRSARARRGRGYHPRWTGVADAFALGSTFASQLCRRYGLDPEERVRR